MKNLLKQFVFVLVLLWVPVTFVCAQAKSFKGIVTYSLSYSGDVDAATMANLPKTSTTYILGNLKKTKTEYGPALVQVITNGDKQEMIILFEQMGMKAYMKLDKAELESLRADKGKPEITYLDETKTIAGYVCKKAVITTKTSDGKTETTEVYYTEELGGEALNFGDDQTAGLKGFPMEVTTTQKGMTIKQVVTAVKKGKVKDTDFLIPADYTELTGEMKEQFKAMLMGNEE